MVPSTHLWFQTPHGTDLVRGQSTLEHLSKLVYMGTRTREEELSGAHSEVSLPHGKKLLRTPKLKDFLASMSIEAEPSLAISTD